MALALLTSLQLYGCSKKSSAEIYAEGFEAGFSSAIDEALYFDDYIPMLLSLIGDCPHCSKEINFFEFKDRIRSLKEDAIFYMENNPYSHDK